MNKVLLWLKWHMCLVYLDDVLVFGRNFEEHQERLELVLMALEKAGLMLNVEKCVFFSISCRAFGSRDRWEGHPAASGRIRIKRRL